ncbi:hypothetical protein V1264_019540 [Littorina saxatilis]|uniref:Uncharacterized protein n=1 Tax=Littorina saxatilis TaxID=31220 RepID=A0AAN9GE43_9CAEN
MESHRSQSQIRAQMHFIFRHKNPKTGEIEEKHTKKPTANIDSYFTGRKTHLYTLGKLEISMAPHRRF